MSSCSLSWSNCDSNSICAELNDRCLLPLILMYLSENVHWGIVIFLIVLSCQRRPKFSLKKTRYLQRNICYKFQFSIHYRYLSLFTDVPSIPPCLSLFTVTHDQYLHTSHGLLWLTINISHCIMWPTINTSMPLTVYCDPLSIHPYLSLFTVTHHQYLSLYNVTHHQYLSLFTVSNHQ